MALGFQQAEKGRTMNWEYKKMMSELGIEIIPDSSDEEDMIALMR